MDTADVVVADRLAPTGLLAGLRTDVLVVDAAKVPRGPSMPQQTINDTLVAHAHAGRRVAVAAAALAGVPVTPRGVAHDLTVVSGHLPPGHPGSLVDRAALGRARGTLVLLMAVDTVAAIAATLVVHGRAPDTPVLAVQDAGHPG